MYQTYKMNPFHEIKTDNPKENIDEVYNHQFAKFPLHLIT